MKNPVEVFLDHNKHNRRLNTQAALAKRANVTPQVIAKIIKGLYPDLPPSVGHVLADNSTESMGFWENAYHSWLMQELFELKKKIDRGEIDALALYSNNLSPYETFKDWRESFDESLMGFCHTFLLPQSSMHRYEAGKNQHLPYIFKERMLFLMRDIRTDEENKVYLKELENLPIRRSGYSD